MKIFLILLSVIFIGLQINAQTKGLILEPSTSVLGKSILDPNGDGYVSSTNAGFTANDVAESEIRSVRNLKPVSNFVVSSVFELFLTY